MTEILLIRKEKSDMEHRDEIDKMKEK